VAGGCLPANKRIKSFCFFFQKEDLFFFEKKNQKTFVCLGFYPTKGGGGWGCAIALRGRGGDAASLW
jgi:hypothetical protein